MVAWGGRGVTIIDCSLCDQTCVFVYERFYGVILFSDRFRGETGGTQGETAGGGGLRGN